MAFEVNHNPIYSANISAAVAGNMSNINSVKNVDLFYSDHLQPTYIGQLHSASTPSHPDDHPLTFDRTRAILSGQFLFVSRGLALKYVKEAYFEGK